MNDFYTETNLEHVDAAMDDMIECRKEENFLNQEDNNILHDLLAAHRHLIEQLLVLLLNLIGYAKLTQLQKLWQQYQLILMNF